MCLPCQVNAGGGYIGTCGGAFLALKHLMLYGPAAIPTELPGASLQNTGRWAPVAP